MSDETTETPAAAESTAIQPTGPDSVDEPRPTIGFRIALVLATVLTAISIFAVWVDRQVLDSGNWASTSTRLLADDNVRKATAVYVADQIYSNVDVQAEIENALPKDAKILAGPAATALRGAAESGVEKALGTSLVQGVWEEANRLASDQLITLVEGGTVGYLNLKGNDVKLDLRPAAIDLAGKLGLQKQAEQIPPGSAVVTVFSNSQVGQVRTVARALEAVAVIFPILALIFYGLAIAASRGRRRKALVAVGWSLIVAALIAFVIRDVAKGPFVDALATTDAVRPAVDSSYGIATSMLGAIGGNMIFVAVLVLLAAALAGPSSPARAIREWLAPWFNERPGLGYAAGYGILFLLILWGPIPATRQWLSLLVIAALTGAGVWALERQLREEFPDAAASDHSESLREAWRNVRSALGEGVSRGGEAAKQAAGQVRERIQTATGSDGESQPANPPSAPSEAPTAPIVTSQPAAGAPIDAGRLELLERLGSLRDSGVLGADEFEAEKAKVLGR